jgi:hypothetical protein
MTLSKLRRMVTNERRALPRAPGTRGIKIRGRWTVSCMYPYISPRLYIQQFH